MTIDHCYWKRDCECHHAMQAEKETLKFHSQKQGKASTSSSTTAFQNKANSASGGLVCQELFLQVSSIPCFQEAT